MNVKCLLREIMTERKLRVKQLARMSGVSRNTITALRGEWMGVSALTIARLCKALNVKPGDLFEYYEHDLCFSIRQHQEVTIHYGSRSSPAALPSKRERGTHGDGLFAARLVAARDMIAVNLIVEHLTSLGAGIKVRLQEHAMGRDSGYGANGTDPVATVFSAGNHIVVGSPIANPWAEPIVAWMFGAEPYTPGAHKSFPLGFVWDSRLAVTSSFGWRGVGPDFGIAATADARLVARRTLVSHERSGSDCALVAAKRIKLKAGDRRFGKDDARTIVCLLGHGSIGTEGAARLAIHPRFAATLFPSQIGRAEMWAVETQYLRPPIADSLDNCVIKEFAVVAP